MSLFSFQKWSQKSQEIHIGSISRWHRPGSLPDFLLHLYTKLRSVRGLSWFARIPLFGSKLLVNWSFLGLNLGLLGQCWVHGSTLAMIWKSMQPRMSSFSGLCKSSHDTCASQIHVWHVWISLNGSFWQIVWNLPLHGEERDEGGPWDGGNLWASSRAGEGIPAFGTLASHQHGKFSNQHTILIKSWEMRNATCVQAAHN